MSGRGPDVLHATSVHRWDDNRIFYKECRSLQSAGLSIALIAVEAPGRPIHGVETIRVERAGAGRLGRMLVTMPRLLWRCLGTGAAVLHIHDPELIPLALVARALGRRIIYDAHEDYPLDILCKPWIPKVLRRPVAAAFAAFERIAVRAFDAVIAATPSIGARLSRYNPRTFVVANYPRLEELVVPADAADGERRDVVYVGYLTEIRGIRVLVDAMGRVKGRLVLAGQFTDPGLEKYVRERLSEGHIEFAGWVDRQQLTELFRKAAVGVAPLLPVPSFVESLPNKLFEYMAAGVPVVASDFPGWKDLVEGLEVGWCVPPGDPEALAERIGHALANPEDARARGRRGREAVETRFNWDLAFGELLRAYRMVMPRPPPGGA
jgi:glycosyltransferase involved in cell wall biosynthesis